MADQRHCCFCGHEFTNEPFYGAGRGDGSHFACQPCYEAWSVLTIFADSVGAALLAVLEDNGLDDVATRLANLRDFVYARRGTVAPDFKGDDALG